MVLMNKYQTMKALEDILESYYISRSPDPYYESALLVGQDFDNTKIINKNFLFWY